MRLLSLVPCLLLTACSLTACSLAAGAITGGDDDDTPPAGDDDNPGTPGARRMVGYFASWDVYGRNYNVADMPVDQLTVINYAFVNISDTGECILGDSYADIDKAYPGDTWDPGAVRGNFHQLQIVKAAHPDLRVVLSIGGWTWSTHFSDVALTDASRTHFAQSCVDLMAQYGFDGLDIDWEYPTGGGMAPGRPEDTQNYTLLLAALRTALDAKQPGLLLTVAAPASTAQIAKIETANIATYLDWINVMTYDFHGGWETQTGFNAPLGADPGDPDPTFNVTGAIDAWLAGGVPANKLVVGMPLYARGWSGVAPTANGLFEPSTGLPMGMWEAGIFDWKELAPMLTTMTRYWSDAAQVPWLYDPTTGVFISYDDPQSLAAKVDFVRARGLGGAMVWELSGDDAQHTLVGAIHDELVK